MLQALMWGQRVRNKNVGLHCIVRLTLPILEQLKPTAESLSILFQQISCWLSVTRTCTLESIRFSEKNVSAHPATYGYLDESSVPPKHTRAEKHVMLVKKPFNKCGRGSTFYYIFFFNICFFYKSFHRKLLLIPLHRADWTSQSRLNKSRRITRITRDRGSSLNLRFVSWDNTRLTKT